MTKILTHALLMYPKTVEFWLYAVSWEFQIHGNPITARKLFQRGLLECKNSRDLWIEYLSFEVAHANKLQIRHSDSNTRINRAGIMKEAESVFATLNVILRTALTVFPSDLAFRIRSIEIIKIINHSPTKTIMSEELCKTTGFNLTTQEEAWDTLLRKDLTVCETNNHNIIDLNILRAIKRYGLALTKINTKRMYHKVEKFICESIVISRKLGSKSISALNHKYQEQTKNKERKKDGEEAIIETRVGVYLTQKFDELAMRTFRKNTNHIYRATENLFVQRLRLESAVLIACADQKSRISHIKSYFSASRRSIWLLKYPEAASTWSTLFTTYCTLSVMMKPFSILAMQILSTLISDVIRRFLLEKPLVRSSHVSNAMASVLLCMYRNKFYKDAFAIFHYISCNTNSYGMEVYEAALNMCNNKSNSLYYCKAINCKYILEHASLNYVQDDTWLWFALCRLYFSNSSQKILG